VTAGGITQFNEVRSGTSYLSQNDLRLHFGLESETVMSAVDVLWPSGKKDTFKDLPADFIYTINEDGGIQLKVPFEKGER